MAPGMDYIDPDYNINDMCCGTGLKKTKVKIKPIPEMISK